MKNYNCNVSRVCVFRLKLQAENPREAFKRKNNLKSEGIIYASAYPTLHVLMLKEEKKYRENIFVPSSSYLKAKERCWHIHLLNLHKLITSTSE